MKLSLRNHDLKWYLKQFRHIYLVWRMLSRQDRMINSLQYDEKDFIPGRMLPVYFCPPSSPDGGAAYLVISKCACTSVKISMLKDPTVPDDYSVHKFYSDPEYILTDIEDPKVFRFTFVRNPLDRLVSCYESKYHVDRDVYKKKKLDFNNYLIGYLREDPGFDQFIRKVVRLPHRLMDRHFASQHMYVYRRDGTPRVDFIGCYERMAEDYEPIRQKYGFDPLPRYNVTGKNDWRDYYTLRTARMVHRKFRKDFRFFDYEESYRDLIRYLKEKEAR